MIYCGSWGGVARGLRLSVGESLFRASEDTLHKLKTFAGATIARRPQPVLLTNSAACSLGGLGPGSAAAA